MLRLGAVFLCSLGFAEPLTLVVDGKAKAAVILPEAPLPSQQLAAEELVSFIKKMSGVELPVIAAGKAPEESDLVRIHVGDSLLVAKLGLAASDLPREGFCLRTVSNNLLLVGEDGVAHPSVTDPFHVYARTGTLFAVYAFLEEVLGVRWLWPGESGEVVPKSETLRIPPLDRLDSPRLFKRQLRPLYESQSLKRYAESVLFYDAAVGQRLQRDEQLWLKRMRMGRNRYLNYGHAFTHWWEKYGQEHPEYFALLPEGQRGPTHPKSPDTVKMCVSQPKLWEKLVSDFKAAHRQSPELAENINACENDGGTGFCTCESCRAWDATDRVAQTSEGPQVVLSDRYCRFYNALAERLALVAPDAWVTAYAYSRYRLAPVKTRLRDRVMIGFVGFGYPSTKVSRAATRADWLAWAKAGARLFLRPNALLSGHGMPYLYTHALAEDFRFCAQNGMMATDFDSLTGYWATTGPTYYVLAKLHWRPEADVERILDDYYSAFGPAADEVRRYFDFWEEWTQRFTDAKVRDRINELSPTSDARGFVKILPEIYREEELARGETLLQAAHAAAEKSDPECLGRVEHLQLGLKHARTTLHALATTLGNVSGWQSSNVEEILKSARELVRFRREIASRNITNVYFLTHQEVRLGDLTGIRIAETVGERQAVVRLTVDNWQFKFDPEKKGDAEKWYLPTHDAKDWARIRVDVPWENTPLGQKWKDEHGKDYDGVAWYRCTFLVPAQYKGSRLKIFFGAVDEDARVWVNDKHVGDHPYVKPDDWKMPFEFEATDAITFDQGNTVVVRVEDNAGAGGIYKPVWILKE